MSDLISVAQKGDIASVQKLIQSGADVNRKDADGNTPLHLAAMNGRVEIVNTLLAKGADVHAIEQDGWTSLHYAAAKGHVEIVNTLLAKGADVHAKDTDGWTPLHWAAENGHVDIVNTLLAQGADVHATDALDGETPLHWAAINGHVEILNILLANGADVHAKTQDGNTPLHYAAMYSHVEIVIILLTKEADVNAKDKDDKTALDLATSNKHVKVVECLKDAMMSIHQRIDTLKSVALESMLTNNPTDMEKIENGNTPLLHAAERGFYEGVEILLRYKANILATQQHTLYSVLHLAMLKGDIPMMQLVLECGQESLINLQDKDGNTALHVVIGLGREDNVQTLLFFYPDMTVRNHQGESVLECAVKLHAWNIFVMLCQHDEAQWNEVSSHREEESWLLMMAYRDRHVGALKWLLEHGDGGVWQDIDTQSGLSILHMVCQELCDHDDLIATCFSPAALVSSSTESLDPTVLHLQVFFQRFQQAPWLLLHYGAEHGKKVVLETVLEACSSADESLINRQDETKDGNTAMHLAVKGGHVGCVRSLLYFYPDLTVVNKDGETALYTAAKQHHWEAVHVLLHHDDGGSSLELHALHPKKAGADSLLMLAVQDKQAEVVRMLIEKAGADVKEMDSKNGLRVLLKLLEEVIPTKEEEVVEQICYLLCSLVEANRMLSYEFKQLDGRRMLCGTITAYHNNDRIYDVVAKIFFLMTSA